MPAPRPSSAWTWVVRGATLVGAVLAVVVVVLLSTRPTPTLTASVGLVSSASESASGEVRVPATCGSVTSAASHQIDVVHRDEAVLGDVVSSGRPHAFDVDQFDLSGLDDAFAASGCDRARSARTGRALELSLVVGVLWLLAAMAVGRRAEEALRP